MNSKLIRLQGEHVALSLLADVQGKQLHHYQFL